MENVKFRKIIRILILICGLGSAVSYILHVIIGGILDPNYSQIRNSISTLTAVGAPNQDVLRLLLMPYHPLYIAFCFLLILLFLGTANRLMTAGSISLAISALISRFGFGAFPFDGEKAGMTFNNTMHIGVVIGVVIFSIAALFLIAVGCLKIQKLNQFGKYLLVLAIIFTAAGGLSAPLTANASPIMGLIEKINIGTLQIFVSSLSIYFFRKAL